MSDDDGLWDSNDRSCTVVFSMRFMFMNIFISLDWMVCRIFFDMDDMVVL